MKNKVLKWVLIGVGIIASIMALIFLALLGYRVYYTGFGPYTVSKSSTWETVPPKFLWDWLELLIIPVILLFGTFFLSHSEEVTRREIAEKQREADQTIADKNNKAEQDRIIDRQREESLQEYINKMTELLLDNKLKDNNNKIVADIARVKTMATVRVLDGKRKGLVLKFLFDSGLINGDKPIVNLEYADFSGTEYSGAYLGGADLSKVDFSNAKLNGINLKKAKVKETIFRNADLSNGIFEETNFDHAEFTQTKAAGIHADNCIFSSIIFSETDLTNSLLTDCTFNSCKMMKPVFTSAKIINLSSSPQEFREGKFNKSKISNANFKGVAFTDVDFQETEFSISDFSETELYMIRFDNAVLAGADFSRSKMIKVSFRNARVHFETTKNGEQPNPDAIFNDAELISDVVMTGANITVEQLHQIANKDAKEQT